MAQITDNHTNNHNTRTSVVKFYCRIFTFLVCACAVSCRTTAPMTSSRFLTTILIPGSTPDRNVFTRTERPPHFPSNVSSVEPLEPAALTNLGEEIAAGSNSAVVEACILVPRDPFQHQIIYDMVNIQGLKLIEYLLVFPNNSVNPLKTNMTKTFKGDSWARVNNAHGQTLLSLAFNYGILSLMTLTFGTDRLPINVEDRPRDCMLALTEDEKLRVTLRLLMRDFDWQSEENITLKAAERVCHEVVANSDGYAKFTDRCCFRDRLTGSVACSAQLANGWLTFLYIMLTSIRFGILAFGPLMFLSTLSGLIREEFPYTVELRDPLIKTMVLYRKGVQQQVIPTDEIKGKHKLDLRYCGGFPKLREIVLNDLAPIGHPFKAKFTQYDINVSYKRLLTENKVPVGFWRSLAQSIFYCKLRHIGPFQKCCRADMLRNRTCRHGVERACGSCGIRSPLPWIRMWKKIGLLLLIFLLPTPYYIRLAIMYVYEYDEVVARKAAASQLGLYESFENSLMHYFMPTHWLFLGIYVIYLVMAFNLSYLARRNEKGRFRKIIVGSFTDLKNLSWMNVLKMMVANVIWPFQRYGLAGCLVVFVYWPIVLPLTTLVYVLYVLPTVYLTVRMFFYSKMAFLRRRARKQPVKRSYRVKHNVDDTVHYFEAGYLLGEGDSDKESRSAGAGSRSASSRQSNRQGNDIRRSTSVRSNGRKMRESVIMSEELDDVTNFNRDKFSKDQRSISVASTIMATVKGGGKVRRILEHCLASGLCVLALYAVLVILSECVGCFAEMLVFTLMGIIVNAGQLLKYVALIVMLVVYSHDCFNNVEKKYLKLNRALFSEVKSRIKDLEKVTSLPSFLQENRGFKSQELGEQAEYELSDDVSDKPARHWLINDLVLFIDNEDMPRIPRKLFEDVCRIRVAGVPGPIYRGQLLAIRQFLKIVVFIFFVFIVILSFGSVYKVSDTNQMIAALAGGSLPFILRTVMEPEKPDIEIGTVSFKNQMDEVIRNFVQYWPIYDLPFQVYTEEEEARDRQRAEEEEAERLAKAAGSRHGSSANLLNSLQHRDSLSLLRGNRPASAQSRPSETFHTCLPTVDPPSFYNNNLDFVDGRRKSSQVEVSSSSLPFGNHIDTAASGVSDAAPRSPKCVMFSDPSIEELPVPEVDIVVYLPNKNGDAWLDEWSDYDTETFDAEHRTDSMDDIDVFGNDPLEMRDLAIRVPAAAAMTQGTAMTL